MHSQSDHFMWDSIGINDPKKFIRKDLFSLNEIDHDCTSN